MQTNPVLPNIRFFLKAKTIGVGLDLFGKMSKILYEMSQSETQ